MKHFSDREKQALQGYYELFANDFDSRQSLRLSEGLIRVSES